MSINENDELLLFQSRNLKSHFIFNTLTAIQYLCRHDSAAANNALITFSSYLRENIDVAGHKTLIPFSEDLKHANDYLTLINYRYKNRVTVINDIKEHNFSLPPLSLCALVENAFKHGVAQKESQGEICISSYKSDNSIIVSVSNDGPQYCGQAFGIGLTDCRERLKRYINASLKIEGVPNNGTLATITIPSII